MKACRVVSFDLTLAWQSKLRFLLWQGPDRGVCRKLLSGWDKAVLK